MFFPLPHTTQEIYAFCEDIPQEASMRAYLTEAIGTFFLVLTIGTVIGSGNGVAAPLAIGAALMAMVFAGGHISGAHYNPAVTLGVWLRGKCATKDVGPYIIAQIIGAVVAALVVGYLRGNPTGHPISIAVGPALLGEFLFTFALTYVVLNVATAKGTAGNSFYGVAIGMTVMSGAYAVGDISGGAFNPAVAVGACFMGLFHWAHLWLYVVAEAAAALAAAAVFKALNAGEL
jgi:aquaporin Z